MTKAIEMAGWKHAKPAPEERKNNYALRERKCNPPRLTTKVANPQKARGK